MAGSYNNKIRQLLLLIVMAGLAGLLLLELYGFFPGFLGAVTLYILSRDGYLYLTEKRRWKKGLTAALVLLAFLICIGVPIWLSVRMLSGKISRLFTHTEEVMQVLQSFSKQIQQWTGQELLTQQNIQSLQKYVTNFIPILLNSTATMLGNLILLLFLCYFMLTSSRSMEKGLQTYIPLHDDNIGLLAKETKNMVRANAIGIPLISIIQGCFAALGYRIFGLSDPVLWGFLTGIFAFFPVVGTMIVWVPLVVAQFSGGHTGQAIGLTIYSVVVTGNVDYLARITLLKRIGDIHPVITVLGVIVGLKLFGFWGFIFGPLLISYFLLLCKIYNIEFRRMPAATKNEE
ncbi:MAG TPA: AI-2E family transporter [Puia sp.]|nr:AI-2E family transporter [Puia sp.]